MLRTLALATTALLLASGCSASVTVGEDATEGPTSSAPTGSSAPAPALDGDEGAEPAQPTLGPGFTMVSGDLGAPGTNGFSAVAGDAAVVAATTYSYSEEDLDAGLATSTDGGMTWQLSGPLDLPDGQRFSDLMITDEGIVAVGSSRISRDNRSIDRALIAVAAAPDYQLEEVPTPEEFAGNVELAAVFADGSDWVIIGTTAKRAGKDTTETDEHPTVWRSPDQGATWTRTVVDVKGSSDTPLYGFTLGPDGSWNLYGQSHSDRGDAQFDAAWLRSTDQGSTFQLMYPDQFRRDHDQGATALAFSPSGAVAVLGWDEIVENGDDISVLWAGPAGTAPSVIGDPAIPVQGGTPPDEFLTGVLWDNETLVTWGTSDGSYPASDVQFWSFDGTELIPSTTLPGDGSMVGLQRILTNGEIALLFGSAGDGEQQNLAVWAGTLGQG